MAQELFCSDGVLILFILVFIKSADEVMGSSNLVKVPETREEVNEETEEKSNCCFAVCHVLLAKVQLMSALAPVGSLE